MKTKINVTDAPGVRSPANPTCDDLTHPEQRNLNAEQREVRVRD